MSRKPPLNAKAATANWERMFKVLRFFQKAHGHCDVPANADPGSLGHWLAEQHKEYRAGRISPERLRRWERLGIDFGVPCGLGSLCKIKRERRWEERLAELADFKKRLGHCEVGRGSKASHGLAVWLSNQRQTANAGRLRPDRWQRLKELGVESGRTDRRWNLRFGELAGYKKRLGHCDVPCHWRENRSLGHWVSCQRNFRNKGWLSQERIDRLDQLGFKWVAHYNRKAPPQSYQNWIFLKDRHWDSMFAALLKYKKKQGDCNVRPDDGLEGRLHGWVLRQRSEARKNLLREDRRWRLDRAGFLWKGYNPSWDKRFSQLLAFKKRFGHCDVPCHWPKDRLLGHWVSNQRSFRKKGVLSQERIDRLDQIGFRWLAPFRLEAPPQSFREHVKELDQLWESKFAEPVRFQRQHGHCRIPSAILHLNLHREYFAQIAAGTKRIEYRAQTPHWKSRLEGRHYDAIQFRNGYATKAPEMLVEFRGLRRYGKGRAAYYAIRLGHILEIKRWRGLGKEKARAEARAGNRICSGTL